MINENYVDYLDTTIFKNQCDPTRLLAFKPTDHHQLLHKQSFHPKHTFKGILKSQINIRFHRICSIQEDFNVACPILFKALKSRNYSKRWLREIKGETIRELEIKSRRANIVAQCGAYECGITKCKSCYILNECDNISSRQTRKTYGIRGKLCCSSTNVVYSLQCLICNKQYIGETSTTPRERMNHHRSAIVNYNKDSYISPCTKTNPILNLINIT